MEINRNQYFMAGIILLLLGIQLRLVDSYVLNAKVTEALAKRTQTTDSQKMAMFAVSAVGGPTNKVIQPPDWIGWCLMSIGSVLILHSLAMKRPGGPFG